MASRPKLVLSPIRKPIGLRRPGRRSLTKRTAPPVSMPSALQGPSEVDAATQRGNIKVVVRVRPPNSKESTVAGRVVVRAVDSNMVLFDPKEESSDFYFRGVKQKCGRDLMKKPNKNISFAFDNVYGPQHVNQEIFEGTIKPAIDTILSGFNCSVFAYGATGAGKTYTMLGGSGNPGLTFLTVMELYQRIDIMKNDFEAEVAVSYLEVYNETVRDLLGSSGVLNVREDSNGVVIPNLTMHKPSDATQLLDMLAFGNSVRSQHPTDHNAESSRSHAVFQVFVSVRGRSTGLSSKYKVGKLVMVDLAGSERGSATNFQGQRFREGASINKSLLALGNCINALADGKKHIPYRDSKLTRILKDSLGGNCKTIMIANVSPAESSYDDTYNTLRYADRAKRIKFQAKKNTLSVSACITQYAKVVEEMGQTIEYLKNQLAEHAKNCCCKTEKTHAMTETDDSLMEASNSCANCSTSNGSNPADTGISRETKRCVELYNRLLTEKMALEQLLVENNSSYATLEFKILMKHRRVETLQQLGTPTIQCSKSLEKMRKQLEVLRIRQQALLAQKQLTKRHLDETVREINASEELCNANPDAAVVVTFKQYLELQNLKSENQVSKGLEEYHRKMCQCMVEELLKNEKALGKGLKCLAPAYKILRHNNYNTKTMDKEYDEIMGDVYGARVHFEIEDDDVENSRAMKVLNNMVHKAIVDCNLLNVSLSEEENSTQSKFKRPPTPLRDNKREVDMEDEGSHCESFNLESSNLSMTRFAQEVVKARPCSSPFEINISPIAKVINSTMMEYEEAIEEKRSSANIVSSRNSTSFSEGSSYNKNVENILNQTLTISHAPNNVPYRPHEGIDDVSPPPEVYEDYSKENLSPSDNPPKNDDNSLSRSNTFTKVNKSNNNCDANSASKVALGSNLKILQENVAKRTDIMIMGPPNMEQFTSLTPAVTSTALTSIVSGNRKPLQIPRSNTCYQNNIRRLPLPTHGETGNRDRGLPRLTPSPLISPLLYSAAPGFPFPPRSTADSASRVGYSKSTTTSSSVLRRNTTRKKVDQDPGYNNRQYRGGK